MLTSNSIFQLEYRTVVSEDVTPTWVIVRVRATDADEYGSLRYELTGAGAESFFLESNSGGYLWQLGTVELVV